MQFLACSAPIHHEFNPPGELEPAALRMGRIVDYTALQPGDLILTQDETPDWISKGIAWVQSTWHPEEVDHASFTHAMMYMGGGFVLESTFEYKKPQVPAWAVVRTIALAIGLDDPTEDADGRCRTPNGGCTGSS